MKGFITGRNGSLVTQPNENLRCKSIISPNPNEWMWHSYSPANIIPVHDSAPFRQGKYIPATHLPVVAPDTLYSELVDAVIVMAASYSDEVAGIIRQKFNKQIKVSILRDSGLEMVDI